jgi:LmbE family N-acetylglucosaminyl deacetylase
MKPFALLALALCLTGASAQTFTDPANLRGERISPRDGRELPIDTGAQGLQQLLRKLNTRASIMNIVAHPDDEDGGMLTLYSRGLGARVADLSLNRGEGGQNAMTADFEDALGLLRTQELLASDRYTGVDQFFGTEVDFGFSKTKEEAFAKWGHDRVLYDVVRAIRIYRPLVLTSTWIGGVTDGHGQHQVSGQIAQEAFVAAGDPKVFPELTAEGILPWQPLKIYARVPMQSISDRGLFDYATGQYTSAKFTNYVTGEVTTTVPSTDVIVHEGTKDPLLTYGGARALDLSGKVNPDTELSYVQFARIGLGLQKSQVSPRERQAPQGAYDVAYHLYGKTFVYAHADTREDNFFDGIDTSIEGIADLAPHAPASLRAKLTSLANLFKKAQQQAQDGKLRDVTTSLLGADTDIQCIEATLDDPHSRGDLGCRLPQPEQYATIPKDELVNVQHELNVKRAQIDEALPLAMGITMDAEAISHDGAVTVGHPLSIAVHIVTLSDDNNPSGLKLEGTWLKPTSTHLASAAGIAWDYKYDVVTPELNRFSPTAPYFTRPTIEQPVYDLLDAALRNAPETPAPLIVNASFCPDSHCFTVSRIVHDRENLQALRFVPASSLSVSAHAQVFPEDQQSLQISATVSPVTAITSFPALTVPPGWKAERIGCHKTGPDSETCSTALGETMWKLSPMKHERLPIVAVATATYLGGLVTEGYRSIGYNDLPRTNYFTPAEIRIVPVKLTFPTKTKIAYLPGTGDSVPKALTSIGLAPTMLTVADLTADKLKQYDTVILGVRTYAARPELHGAPTQALLDFARNGGNVIVQYQTAEFTAADAPYPLSLGSNEKVVDETAPVRLPEDNEYGERLLVVPNKITPSDFNGWVEERGHGFLATWDSHYSAPTETHDPGQDPQRGGLITTALGKGRWTYVAFALYRQLPEAVPGAFRLFANLLSPE